MHDAFVRIERAKRGVERLHETVETTDTSDTHKVVTESDGEGHVRLIARVFKPPPEEWRLAIGDILVDLRSALDYATYALAAKHTSQVPPPDERGIEFPIAESPDWFRTRGKRKIRHLNAPAQTYIESVQAYQPGYGGNLSALRILNELAGLNKHRFVPVIWHVLASTTVHTTISGATIEDFVAHKIDGELKNNAVLATFRMIAAEGYAQVQIQPSIATHIAFEPGPPAFGMEVVTTLGAIGGAVEDVVTNLAAF